MNQFENINLASWPFALIAYVVAGVSLAMLVAPARKELLDSLSGSDPASAPWKVLGRKTCGSLVVLLVWPLFVVAFYLEDKWRSESIADMQRESRIIYSGGDGTSREAAIVIGIDDPMQGVRAEYKYIQQIHGLRDVTWKRDTQINTCEEGREYDVIRIVLADGTKKTFWFDISRFKGQAKEKPRRPVPDFDPRAIVAAFAKGSTATYEKLGEQLLRDLPHCTSKVVVAGPRYDRERYEGNLIVDTAALLPWAEQHAGGIWCGDDNYMAAIRIFPVWLKGADLGDSSLTYVKPPFRRVVGDYAHIFAGKNILKAACPKCGQLVSPIIMQEFDPSNWMTEWVVRDWHCPDGHLLRRALP